LSNTVVRWVLAICTIGICTLADAEMSAEELAKLAQNPLGNLISLPFQNNANLNFGPDKGTQNVLNTQPVTPISINDDTQLSAYYNVVRPDFGPNWQIRAQVQLMFPK